MTIFTGLERFQVNIFDGSCFIIGNTDYLGHLFDVIEISQIVRNENIAFAQYSLIMNFDLKHLFNENHCKVLTFNLKAFICAINE